MSKSKHKKGCTFEQDLAATPPPPVTPPKDKGQEAMEIVELLEDAGHKLGNAIDGAEAELEMATAKRDFVADKASRVLCGHCRTAQDLQAMMELTWTDHQMTLLLSKANLKAEKEHGADDQAICQKLRSAWGSHHAASKFAEATAGNSWDKVDVANLRVAIGVERYRGDDSLRVVITGKKVIDAARRLLKIPQPTKAPPPAKPATTPAAKKPAPKTPAPKAPPRPAPVAAAAASRNVPGDRPKQTFLQWLASVKGICSRKGGPAPDGADAIDELREKYNAGVSAPTAAMIYRGEKLQPVGETPAAPPKPKAVKTPATVVLYFSSVTPLTLQAFARDMWLAGTIADKAASDRVRGEAHADLPLIQRLEVEEKLEALAFEAGVTWIPVAPRPLAARRADAMAAAVDRPEPEPLEQRASAPVPIADVLPGVTAADLRAAYSYETLTTGRVRRVFVDAARDCWVVMGMHLESDSFSLMPCVPIDRYPGPTESWPARRRQKLSPGQPFRFEGITFAEQESERCYVFTNEADQVNVIARPAAAAPAQARKAGAA